MITCKAAQKEGQKVKPASESRLMMESSEGKSAGEQIFEPRLWGIGAWEEPEWVRSSGHAGGEHKGMLAMP